MSKYDPLAEYLRGVSKRGTRLTFDEIERILGTSLPPSAHKYQRWWNGNSAVWLYDGWRAIPDLRKNRVTFVRDRIAKRLLADRLRPPRRARQPRVSRRQRRKQRKAAKRAAKGKSDGVWGGVQFRFVCTIVPEGRGGKIATFTPHKRYANPRGIPLHAWGSGPFCRFQIPPQAPESGVYVIVVNDEVKYVGETENLTNRFNNGYGSISPRACYTGGQSTNCHVNSLILVDATKGSRIELWFTPSTNRKGLETELIRTIRPLWNRK